MFSNLFVFAEAPHAGQLRICRISHSSSSVHGGQEIFLLCDKVQKGIYLSYVINIFCWQFLIPFHFLYPALYTYLLDQG